MKVSSSPKASSKETYEPLPSTSRIPPDSSPRLIDRGILHALASKAGAAERYKRGLTPQTIHVWWARRPHLAMRALTFACLSRNDSALSISTIEKLMESFVPPVSTLAQARKLLTRGGNPPRLLDMFGGGGTISYEGALLGAETYAIDSNELSVFIQKTLLAYSQTMKTGDLSQLVADSGKRVLTHLKTVTEELFPLRDKVFGYLWTYSLPCPKCQQHILLSKRPWLSKKRGKRTVLTRSGFGFKIGQAPKDFEPSSAWRGRTGEVECTNCSARAPVITIKAAREELAALIEDASPGKIFHTASPDALPSQEAIAAFEQNILSHLGISLPTQPLPRWSGIVNPSLYGIESYSDLFSPRQRAVLLALIACLQEEYDLLKQDRSEEESKAIVAILSGLIDQLIDWNSRLSMWIPQNEQVGRAFSGPGIAMLWDFVETDPVLDGPANLWKKLARIVAGTEALKHIASPAHIQKACAQALPFQDHFFDAVVTDPPYYDNIYYNALADFFFCWKRLLFQKLEPELFQTTRTDSSRELVASKFRSGSTEKAHEDYCEQLGLAVKEAERVLKPEGVFSMVYSHSSFAGWEAIVRAYRPSNLWITSVQPLGIERKARPRAMSSEAINTCVVFVARKGTGAKGAVSEDEFRKRLRENLALVIEILRRSEWGEEDIGVAAYAHGVGMLCNVVKVEDLGDHLGTLRLIEAAVREHLSSFQVVHRKSL